MAIFREKFVCEFNSNNKFSENFTALRFLAQLSPDLFNNSRIQKSEYHYIKPFYMNQSSE